MRIPKATFKKSGVVGLLGVASLLMTSVSPAAAVTVGAGGGTGWEYPQEAIECDFFPLPPPPSGFPAAELPYDEFRFDHSGTFDAYTGTVPTGTPAAYLGDTDVYIKTERHYISPAGTHPAAPGCPDIATLNNVDPGFVEIADVTIEGTAPLPSPDPGFPFDSPFPTMPVEGSVRCDLNRSEGPNQYIRVQSAVLFNFNVDCTITGNVEGFRTTVKVDDVRMTIQGEMTPCLLVPPADVIENPECQVLEDNDAGSHLVTTYDAVEPDPFG